MATRKKTKSAWNKRGDFNERQDAIMRSLNAVLKDQSQPQTLRMQDIANRLGLVKGNLYYYFKNKQDLIYQCRVKCQQLSLSALERTRSIPGTPSERLRTLIIEHILGIIEGEYSAVLLADRGTVAPSHHRNYVRLRDEFELGFRELIRDGIESGEFLKQDVRMAGFAILGAISWIPRWYHPDGGSPARAVAEQFADFFIRGLQGRR